MSWVRLGVCNIGNYVAVCMLYVVMFVPFVQVTVWAGMSVENKKKTVEGITKIFESMGIPSQATTVVILEVPRENWATGGKLHSETAWNPPE